MQPRGKSQSPQPIVSTRPADMTFEDEKVSDTDQITSRFVLFSLNFLINKIFFFNLVKKMLIQLKKKQIHFHH